MRLPEYLGQPAVQEQDVRGGAISLVKGSRVTFVPTANRPLRSAHANDEPCEPAGATFTTAELLVDDARQIELEWQDEFGLTCKEPFKVAVTALDDEAPQLACEDLPRGRVVLDTEQLVFHVRARDDFGVQEVGMEWKGLPSEHGRKAGRAATSLLAAGGHDKAALDVQGTFTANSLGIEPQPIELRIFATDYFPGPQAGLHRAVPAVRAQRRAARDLGHRAAGQVAPPIARSPRPRAAALRNQQAAARHVAGRSSTSPKRAVQIERQADAERANGRRLANLTETGKELLRQAARNPEIGVGHLDKWAEMLQILDDISANRMPSVADLLKDASQCAASRRVCEARQQSPHGWPGTRVRRRPGSENKEGQKPAATPPVPQVVDVESSQATTRSAR